MKKAAVASDRAILPTNLGYKVLKIVNCEFKT